MRDYQSFSSLNTYSTCGMRYYFRYCEGIKVPPSVAILQGDSVHVGLEVNDKQKIESLVDLPVDDVLDATSTQFEKKRVEVEDWEGQNKGTINTSAPI